MKRTLLVLLIFWVTVARSIAGIETSIMVTPTGSKSVYTITLNKKFKGGHLEILSATGDCVTCLTIIKSKITIDLREVRSGAYQVVVEKDGQTEKLQFIQR